MTDWELRIRVRFWLFTVQLCAVVDHMPVIDYIVFRRQISFERSLFLGGEDNAGRKIVGYVWIAAIFRNFCGSHLLLLELVVEICGSGTRYESGRKFCCENWESLLLLHVDQQIAWAGFGPRDLSRAKQTLRKSTKPDLFFSWRRRRSKPVQCSYWGINRFANVIRSYCG